MTGWPQPNSRITIAQPMDSPAVLSDSESFAARARKLVTRGFKPKDAAQITLQEITFENRNDPTAAKKGASRRGRLSPPGKGRADLTQTLSS